MIGRPLFGIVAIVGLLAAAPAAAPSLIANWAVDPAQSRIGFTALWLGKPVNGSFRRWNAYIDFDPAKPQAGQIIAVIDLASISTGDSTADGALPEADWFSVKSYPVARFTSQHIIKTAAGYAATGHLTMRGKTVPLVLPFTLTANGKAARVQAQITLDRRSWNLGIDSDSTAEYVAFAVPVRISLQAMRLR